MKKPVKFDLLKEVNYIIGVYVFALLLVIYSYINNSALIFDLIRRVNVGIFGFTSVLFSENKFFSSLQLEKRVENKVRLCVGAAFLMTSFFIVLVAVQNQARARIGYIIIYIISIVLFAAVKRLIAKRI